MSDYREHAPCPALRPFVACYWTRTSAPPEPGGPAARRVLPDGAIDLVFDLAADRSEDAFRLVGTMKK